jgi:RNA binding exosome subunit
MIPDPTDEIKAVRHRLGAEQNFDLHRIIEDIRRRQQESGREYIRLPKQKARITMRSTGAAKASRVEMEDQSSPPRER